MTKAELIKALQELPDDAIITALDGCHELGDYSFEERIVIEPGIGYRDDRGTIWTEYSNYKRDTDEKVRVWVIG